MKFLKINSVKTLIEIINNRETGVAIIEPEISNKKFDKEFLVKLSTGLAYLVGNPNFDSMTTNIMQDLLLSMKTVATLISEKLTRILTYILTELL